VKKLEEKRRNNILLRIENLEKKMEKIDKFLKGRTLARFKYVKSNYKYINDIYAELKNIWSEIESIKKIINVKDDSITVE